MIPVITLSSVYLPKKFGRQAVYASRFNDTESYCIGADILYRRILEIYGKEKSPILPPQSDAALIGTMLHELKVFLSNNLDATEDEILDKADAILSKLSRNVSNRWPMLRHVPEQNYDAVFRINTKSKSVTAESGPKQSWKVVREKFFDSKEQLGLVGTLDYYVISPDHTKAIIKDYKTGIIFEDGHIKQQYCDQLNLYALLLRSHYPELQTIQLILTDLNGTEYPVPAVDSCQMKQRLIRYLALFQDGLENPDNASLYRPSEKCHLCNCAHICKFRHWNTPDKVNAFTDFSGVLSVLCNREVSLKRKERSINIIPVLKHAENIAMLKTLAGKRVYVNNLRVSSVETDIIKCSFTDRTIFCVLED